MAIGEQFVAARCLNRFERGAQCVIAASTVRTNYLILRKAPSLFFFMFIYRD
jgi:hypothetical protein